MPKRPRDMHSGRFTANPCDIHKHGDTCGDCGFGIDDATDTMYVVIDREPEWQDEDVDPDFLRSDTGERVFRFPDDMEGYWD